MKWGESIKANLSDFDNMSKTAFGLSLAAQKGGGGMKPASSYDYSQDEIPGKREDDLNYIFNGGNGNLFSRAGEIFARDWRQSSTSDKVNLAMAPFAFFRIGKLVSKVGDAHETKSILQNAIGGTKVFEKFVGRNPDVMFRDGRIFFTPSRNSPFYGRKPFDTGLDVLDYFHIK